LCALTCLQSIFMEQVTLGLCLMCSRCDLWIWCYIPVDERTPVYDY
jgi:hypothetical protein